MGAIRDGTSTSLLDEGTKLTRRNLEAFEQSAGTDEFVIIRVSTTSQVELLARTGWEVVTTVPGATADATEYLLRVRRGMLVDEFGAKS